MKTLKLELAVRKCYNILIFMIQKIKHMTGDGLRWNIPAGHPVIRDSPAVYIENMETERRKEDGTKGSE